ncbi:MAG: GNAT family N-acetyltransferase [Candidatus Bipolaricaulota bacterium]|nr:GNAT family N-acetyltransferase [Candidatus Bipolaricaulota bacterium]MDW8127219.1 GNAT family N-acetyltransferase [Candidatus Bipolaricaulota bacterium]
MTLKIRELREDTRDFAAIVNIDNVCDPEHRYTVEQFRYDYEKFDTKKYVMRYYLAEVDGKAVGYACYHHMPQRFHPQRFWIWIAVLPEFRHREIGSALYTRILADLQALAAKFLHTSTRETWADTIRFLEKQGFREVMRSWESHLDVTSFDPRPFEEYLVRVEREGIVLTTLAAEKEADPDWLVKVHALHNAVMADVPSSAPFTPLSLEEFQRRTLNNPDLLPDGYFLAKKGGEYVGESFVFRIPAEPGHLSQGLTGVRREYRGKGIALALKLKVIAYAKAHGYTLIKTWNATTNQPMLAINEKLGFRRQPAWIEYAKTLA